MGKYGLSALIGDAYSTGPIASILSPFVLGMLVDRFFASQKVLGVLHLIGAALLWWLPGAFESGQSGLLWIIFGYMLCYMPTIALSNNVAFHSLANSEKGFPIVRAFGTIGWIVAGLIVGTSGLSDSTGIFTLAAVASVVLGFTALRCPIHQRQIVVSRFRCATWFVPTPSHCLNSAISWCLSSAPRLSPFRWRLTTLTPHRLFLLLGSRTSAA